MNEISYRSHCFPPVVIQHAVWLYLRFTSSRPTSGVSAERKASNRLPSPLSPDTRQARCGSAKPASCCGPRSSRSNSSPIWRRVASAITSVFGVAKAGSRALRSPRGRRAPPARHRPHGPSDIRNKPTRRRPSIWLQCRQSGRPSRRQRGGSPRSARADPQGHDGSRARSSRLHRRTSP
jgi:hypothetical protein